MFTWVKNDKASDFCTIVAQMRWMFSTFICQSCLYQADGSVIDRVIIDAY
jgi:hypothetical protein